MVRNYNKAPMKKCSDAISFYSQLSSGFSRLSFLHKLLFMLSFFFSVPIFIVARSSAYNLENNFSYFTAAILFLGCVSSIFSYILLRNSMFYYMLEVVKFSSKLGHLKYVGTVLFSIGAAFVFCAKISAYGKINSIFGVYPSSLSTTSSVMMVSVMISAAFMNACLFILFACVWYNAKSKKLSKRFCGSAGFEITVFVLMVVIYNFSMSLYAVQNNMFASIAQRVAYAFDFGVVNCQNLKGVRGAYLSSDHQRVLIRSEVLGKFEYKVVECVPSHRLN